MTQTPSDDLIVRYLAERVSDGDVASVRAYLAANSERRGIVAGLQAALNAEDIAGAPPEIEASLAEFLARFEREFPNGKRHVSSRTIADRSFPRRPWAVMIAAVVVTIASFLAIDHVASRAPVGTAKSYATGIGQRATVTLIDGSRIVLAPQSQLVVTPGFGQQHRVLSLRGEAYFEVSRSADAPFIVQTAGITTRVLGTTFDVRRYPGDQSVRVTVTAGKVASGGKRSSVIISAGSVGTITDSTAIAAATPDAEATTAWTQGRMVFRNTPVTTMLETVSRWYGYEFRLADSSLRSQNISAVFNISPSEQTLAEIRELLDATMTFDGRVITVRAQDRTAKSHPVERKQHLFPSTSEVGR